MTPLQPQTTPQLKLVYPYATFELWRIVSTHQFINKVELSIATSITIVLYTFSPILSCEGGWSTIDGCLLI